MNIARITFNPPFGQSGPFCRRFLEGPPKAQVDPAPLGPKDCKLKGEELALYQFIASGQKVSPLAGSRVVGATTV